MSENEELGHEPDQTRDRRFAPVNEDSDARGRTTPRGSDTQRHEGGGVPGDSGAQAQADQAGGEQGLATGGGAYSQESGSPYGKAGLESDLGAAEQATERDYELPEEDTLGPPGTRTPAEEGMQRQEDAPGGTGVPGVDVGHPDALPPTEEGVREAERGDASRDH